LGQLYVSVPIQARTLAQLTPVNIASWALGGFYFSLMPSPVRVATGATLPIVGALVVAALTFRAFSGKVESGFPSKNATMQRC
jgi:hypothetical protein